MGISLLPFLLLVLLRATDGPGPEADDYGQYLMHAEALAEGRAYGDIGYIYTPYGGFVGPRLAPPGVPLVLAPVLAFFGRNPVAIKATMFVFALALLLLAGRHFAMHDDRRLGLAVVLLSGLSANVVHASTQALSDIPFAAACWAVILLYDRPGPWRAPRMLLAALLMLWAVLFRPVGIVLLPAGLLYTVLRFREHGFRPAVPVLALATAGVALLLALPGELPLVISPTTLARALHVHEWAWDNIATYRLGVFDSHLYPFPWARANDAYHVLSAGLMALGLLGWLRHAWRRFAVVFMVLYAAALVILPFSQERYLWPLFPITVFGLVNGVRLVASRLAPARPAGWAAQPALGFAVVLAFLGAAQVAAQPRREGLAEAPELQQVFAYLKALEPAEQVRVAFHKPRTFAWESGIPAMVALRRPPDVTLAELRDKRITHVVVPVREDPQARDGIRRTLQAAPQAFEIEYRNASYIVYRFLAERATGAASAPVH